MPVFLRFYAYVRNAAKGRGSFHYGGEWEDLSGLGLTIDAEISAIFPFNQRIKRSNKMYVTE